MHILLLPVTFGQSMNGESVTKIMQSWLIACAIRTAHMLSVGMAGIIKQTSLSYEGQRIVLGLPKALSALDGERLRRRFAALGDHLERQTEVKMQD